MDFAEITQGMLEEYEKQYFDVVDVPGQKGAHRYASGNIASAEKAGWLAESVNGLGPLDRLQLSRSIDEKYNEFTRIDPNG